MVVVPNDPEVHSYRRQSLFNHRTTNQLHKAVYEGREVVYKFSPAPSRLSFFEKLLCLIICIDLMISLLMVGWIARDKAAYVIRWGVRMIWINLIAPWT